MKGYIEPEQKIRKFHKPKRLVYDFDSQTVRVEMQIYPSKEDYIEGKHNAKTENIFPLSTPKDRLLTAIAKEIYAAIESGNYNNGNREGLKHDYTKFTTETIEKEITIER